MKTCDALVIGAGPAGATAALRLAQAGLSVVVVEKSPFPRRKVCGEYISATTWPLLEELGVASSLAKMAGPPVRRVGLFAGDVTLDAPMPRRKPGSDPVFSDTGFGRAVGRQYLDTLLLERAVQAGADLRQPATVETLVREENGHRAVLEVAKSRRNEIAARFVVAANGSWERSPIASGRHSVARDSDLLGFKARFHAAHLPVDLMPLVLFPGGYGGLVHSDAGVVSFSCCIRRDALRSIRAGYPSAGDAVLAHVMRHCRGVRDSLSISAREGPWLAAGPIRPGIRALYRDGVFTAGNAAGEAHPLVAEGITMAIQSAWLLAAQISSLRGLSPPELQVAGDGYSRQWRAHFAMRVRASSAFATLTMAPATAAMSVELLRRLPSALTLGARWSGKTRGIALAGNGP